MADHEVSPDSRTPDGWWRRHWKWVVPVLVLVPLLTCTGTAFFVADQVFSLIKKSEPYQLSLMEVRANADVQAALGAPIEDGFFVAGQIKMGRSASTADVSYRVTGPNGRGSVHVVADTSAGAWVLTTHTLRVDDSGRTIDLRGGDGE